MVDFGSALGGLFGGLAQGAEAGISLSQKQQQIQLQQEHSKLQAINMIASLEKWSPQALQTMGQPFFKQVQKILGPDVVPDAAIAGYLKGDPEFQANYRK